MMTLREEVLRTVETLPDYKLETLLQFTRFLKESKYTAGMQDNAEKDDAEINEVLANEPVRHGRWIKKIWMSDDFNDPMDFVSDEEMRVLDAMRSRKKIDSDSELHEEAV